MTSVRHRAGGSGPHMVRTKVVELRRLREPWVLVERADDGVEEAAAVAPAVLEADEEVGGLGDDAVKGLPDTAEGVGIDVGGGGAEEGVLVEEAIGVGVAVGGEAGDDVGEVEGIALLDGVAVAVAAAEDAGPWR